MAEPDSWFGTDHHLAAPGDDEPFDWCDLCNMPVWTPDGHRNCDHPTCRVTA